MGFIDAMEDVLNEKKTLTTNGAVAYRTSGKKLLDFNFAVSAMRNLSESAIAQKFEKVFYEDRMTAVKYLFYVSDVREGLGERKIFRACFDWLAVEQPEIAKAVMSLVPEYSRWDNVSRMIESENVSDVVADIIVNQLTQDLENMKAKKPISLCAKWMQSENASSPKTKAIAKKIRESLKISPRQYRKTLSALRKYLDVVEIKMSSKEWGAIDYEKVPSRANLIYNGAFLKNDEERRREYLASLSKGEAKINASVLQPHEIAYKYRYAISRTDETLEALWKALPNLGVDNTLVIRDGSGSMTWGRCGNNGSTPLDVATALAIYMAERNTGDWKDKYITFSARPKIVNLKNCKSLREKIKLSLAESDCSNTNIYATMKLILDTAVKNHMSQEDMPKTIVICSDMQFDGRAHNFGKSLFDSISDEYKAHGYMLPQICFWNLDGRVSGTIPMQQNDLGLILCSGFSVQILKMFMSGKTDPYDVLLEQLNSERYAPVEAAYKTVK